MADTVGSYIAKPSWEGSGKWRVFKVTPSPDPRRSGATGRQPVTGVLSEQEAIQIANSMNSARMDREDDRLIGEDVRRSSRAADRDEVIANAYEHGFDDEELGR